MAEYEMVAFRDDKNESVASMWFGQRPTDEWVYKLAEDAELGEFRVKHVREHVHLGFENGFIIVRKHTG